LLGANSQGEGDSELTNNIELSKSSFKPLVTSIDGVDIAVEDVIRGDNMTIIELSYNNHQYDLSAMDAKNGSSLSGIRPYGYDVLDSAMGGHHAQATMTFEGDLYGELVVGLNEFLIFKFNI